MPTSVPTISCRPRWVTHVAGTSGRFPEMSLNVWPALGDEPEFLLYAPDSA